MMRPEPSERLVFSQVVEGLIKHGLRNEVSPALKGRLRGEGLDLDRPLLPAYPVDAWNRCIRHMADEVFPGLPREQALRELAARNVSGLGETLIGRALYGVLRLIGPRRMVMRLPRDVAGTDNYSNVTVTEVGPNQWRMWMNSRLELPGYAESLFESMLRVAGAKSPVVEVIRKGENETEYLLRWS